MDTNEGNKPKFNAQKLLESTVWTECFRPNSLDAVIMTDRVRRILSAGPKDHILLPGHQGIGKTTISRILANGYETLTINASLERGIDTVRDKIINFCSQSSLMDGHNALKVVMLEEADGFTDAGWCALRPIMEQFHSKVRFIANCNYVNKIPAPILSRFTVIHLEPQTMEEEQELMAKYIARTYKLLNNVAQIKAGEEEVKALVESYFPDMRSIVKKCQELKNSGATELNMESLRKSFDHSDLFNIIINQSDPWENYKYIVSEWANKPEEGLIAIGKDFPEFLRNVVPEKIAYLPYVLKSCANYQDMETRAIDKLIPLLALVAELQMILHAK